MENKVIDEDNRGMLKIIRGIKSYLIFFLIVLTVIFFINLFLIRVVKVDGHSMDTTLHDGQMLILDEISYKFKDPERYEIVVFPHGDKYYIKRIIGLPGETVQIKDGAFYVNNKKLDENYGLEPIKEEMYGRAKEPVKLGSDEYFCVGDNRNHSGDSRLSDVGNVKKSIIEGRAIFRIWPFNNFGRIK